MASTRMPFFVPIFLHLSRSCADAPGADKPRLYVRFMLVFSSMTLLLKVTLKDVVPI
jgi:hypothetical protein